MTPLIYIKCSAPSLGMLDLCDCSAARVHAGSNAGIENAAAIVSAACLRSVVTMTIRATRAWRSIWAARGVSRLSSSPSKTLRSAAVNGHENTQADRHDARRKTRTAQCLGSRAP